MSRFKIGEHHALDTATHGLQHSGGAIQLQPQLSRLLEALARKHGQLVTHDELHRVLWSDQMRSATALKSHVHNLRKLLDEAGLPDVLLTVRGEGFILEIPCEAIQETEGRPDSPSEDAGPARATPLWKWIATTTIALTIGVWIVIHALLTAAPIELAGPDGSRMREIDGMPMVPVPGGSFEIGLRPEVIDALYRQARDEGLTDRKAWGFLNPARYRQTEEDLGPLIVETEDFWIDAYEVSNAQYAKFLHETDHRNPEHSDDPPRHSLWENRELTDPELERHPVVNVSYHDAAAYCDWAGGRLPTEYEWEKAARGTDRRLYPWGNEWLPGRANTGKIKSGGNVSAPDGLYVKTTPVDHFPQGASPYGAQNMAGNVWEWTADWFDVYRSVPPERPLGPTAGRTFRGGSWLDVPARCNTTSRDYDRRRGEFRDTKIGFRCASTTPPD